MLVLAYKVNYLQTLQKDTKRCVKESHTPYEQERGMIKAGAHHTSANRMKWKALIRQTHEGDPKEEDRKRHRKFHD